MYKKVFTYFIINCFLRPCKEDLFQISCGHELAEKNVGKVGIKYGLHGLKILNTIDSCYKL